MSSRPGIILIVEDDHDLRVCFRMALELADLEVHTAANGYEALKLLESTVTPQLILLDLRMPVMDGKQFLDEIRLYPEYKNIPVLIVTAHFDKYEIKDSTPHLKKPVDLDVLIEKVLLCLKEAALGIS